MHICYCVPEFRGVGEVEKKTNCWWCLLAQARTFTSGSLEEGCISLLPWTCCPWFFVRVVCNAHHRSLITNVTLLCLDPKRLWRRLKVQLLFNAQQHKWDCFPTFHYRLLAMFQILFGLDRTCTVPAMVTASSALVHTHTCKHSWTEAHTYASTQQRTNAHGFIGCDLSFGLSTKQSHKVAIEMLGRTLIIGPTCFLSTCRYTDLIWMNGLCCSLFATI